MEHGGWRQPELDKAAVLQHAAPDFTCSGAFLPSPSQLRNTAENLNKLFERPNNAQVFDLKVMEPIMQQSNAHQKTAGCKKPN